MEFAWLAAAFGLALAVTAIALATAELSRRTAALQRSIVALRDLRPGVDAVRVDLARLERDLSRTTGHRAVQTSSIRSIGPGR